MVRCRGEFDASMVRAVIETLENLAFVEVQARPASIAGPVDGVALCCRLLINEPLQGEVRLCMPRALLRQITRIIWAMQEFEVQDTVLHDTQAELLNTLAGRFLAELLPEDETFQLGLPEFCPCEERGRDEQVRVWYFALGSDQFQVSASGESLLNAAGTKMLSHRSAPKDPLSF
ncbi:MAG: hypothetical protein BWK76_06820 [Desulfobulbaceae bacterium A2]|nr:MAG: hypothetical protein BWK76_06820 [Desulfobulbaceae bacterium A2]